MRRWLSVILALAAALAALWAWPLLGAYGLASAARRGDAAEVMERVDLPALRRSLARQIAGAYLKASGKAPKLGALGMSLAGAAATTVADPYVADLLTPGNITALIGQGRIGTLTLGKATVAVGRPLPDLAALFRADALSTVTGSSFDGIASFVIPLAEAGSPDAYAVHLRLNGLAWRLSGLDLPPALLDGMARAVLKNEAPPAPTPGSAPSP